MKKVFIFLFLLFAATPVLGAGIFLSVPNEVGQNDLLSVDVKVDSFGESVNALETSVVFDKDVFDFKGYKTDGSVIGFWVETPAVKDNKVHFAGVILGGADGLYDPNKKNTSAPLPVVTLLFKPKSQEEASFFLTDSALLKNDGLGSPIPLEAEETKNVNVVEGSIGDATEDIRPPLEFTPEFVDSSIFSKTPKMISFSTTDNDSGIEYFEMKINGGEWIKVQSPAPIPAGLLDRTITIRAYDFYGNTRDSVLVVPGSLQLRFVFIGFIILLSFVWLYKLLK